jgi:hypothetical protein
MSITALCFMQGMMKHNELYRFRPQQGVIPNIIMWISGDCIALGSRVYRRFLKAGDEGRLVI